MRDQSNFVTKAAISGIFCIIQVVNLGFASIATADWQYTRWGMSSDQILRASKGKARVSDDQRYASAAYDPALEAPYSSGPYNFVARFNVKKGEGLILVVLKGPINECETIKSTLVGKYGEPDALERRQFGHFKFYDRKSNNIIVASSDMGSCDIIYRPLSKGGDKGL